MPEQNHLRTSERVLFKRCQWAWERNYIDRLQPRRRHSQALWFGTGIHLALELWYKTGRERGVHPAETWTKYALEGRGNTEYINTYLDGDFSEAVSATELGQEMLNNYVEHYGREEHLEVISAEQTFQIPLKHRSWQFDGNGDVKIANEISRYVGTFDLVVRDHSTGKIWLWDHKTCASLGQNQYLPLDDQAGSYWAIADYTLRKQGLIGEKESISGIMYNFLVKRKPDRRPRNAAGHATNKPQKKHYVAQLEGEGLDKMKIADLESLAEEQGVEVLGEVSANQPSPILDREPVYRSRSQIRSQLERIQNDLESMSLVRHNLLAATKNPTKECNFCDYRDICELDEQNKDWTDYAESQYTTWDPYEAHRKVQEP